MGVGPLDDDGPAGRWFRRAALELKGRDDTEELREEDADHDDDDDDVHEEAMVSHGDRPSPSDPADPTPTRSSASTQARAFHWICIPRSPRIGCTGREAYTAN